MFFSAAIDFDGGSLNIGRFQREATDAITSLKPVNISIWWTIIVVNLEKFQTQYNRMAPHLYISLESNINKMFFIMQWF